MSYIYEEKEVKKGRKDKWCDVCNKDIPKGTQHYVVTAHEAEFISLTACSEECKKELYQKWNNED